MIDVLGGSWPWYVAGPLIGLMVPALLLVGGKMLGVSGSLRHMCAAAAPGRADFFRYDWKSKGAWSLAFVVGILIGGFIAGHFFVGPEPVEIAARTRAELAALGITDFSGLVPADLFAWGGLLTLEGFVAIVVGGFCVGFGSVYAGGCTSGHGVSGLANLQPASLIAVVGFFVGGLIATHLLLPLIL